MCKAVKKGEKGEKGEKVGSGALAERKSLLNPIKTH